ncbi:hypothetical protein BASA61_004395 [Batrachochytrium salamandrivorans]|nr:hypothetical protein BASA60_010586 [Batrachochytrium salamandrivorans]KAH6593008.1 hypothetical protein BASA61_004395 [Batrachochytrium salamandrivorans]
MTTSTKGRICYTTEQMLSLRNSPLVQRLPGMPDHAEIFQVKGKVIPLRRIRPEDPGTGGSSRAATLRSSSASMAYPIAGPFGGPNSNRPLAPPVAHPNALPARPTLPSKPQPKDISSVQQQGGRNPVRRTEPGSGPSPDVSSRYLPPRQGRSSRAEPEWASFSKSTRNGKPNATDTTLANGVDDIQKFKAMMRSQQTAASKVSIRTDDRIGGSAPGSSGHSDSASQERCKSSPFSAGSSTANAQQFIDLKLENTTDAARMLYSKDLALGMPNTTTKRRSRFERLFEEDPVPQETHSMPPGLQNSQNLQPQIQPYPHLLSQQPHVMSEEDAMKAILARQISDFNSTRASTVFTSGDALADANARLDPHTDMAPLIAPSAVPSNWRPGMALPLQQSLPPGMALSEDEVLERMGVRIPQTTWRKSTAEEDKQGLDRIMAALSAASISQGSQQELLSPAYPVQYENRMYHGTNPPSLGQSHLHHPNQFAPSNNFSHFSTVSHGEQHSLHHDYGNAASLYGFNPPPQGPTEINGSPPNTINDTHIDHQNRMKQYPSVSYQPQPPHPPPPPPFGSYVNQMHNPMYFQQHMPPPPLMGPPMLMPEYMIEKPMQPPSPFESAYAVYGLNPPPPPPSAYQPHPPIPGMYDQMPSDFQQHHHPPQLQREQGYPQPNLQHHYQQLTTYP